MPLRIVKDSAKCFASGLQVFMVMNFIDVHKCFFQMERKSKGKDLF